MEDGSATALLNLQTKKKGCCKQPSLDAKTAQRLAMYIVTSKPKRISVYSGLFHMVFS